MRIREPVQAQDDEEEQGRIRMACQ